LSAVEVARIREAAAPIHRVVYPGGSVSAVSGRVVLFASGGGASFEALWSEAQVLIAAVASPDSGQVACEPPVPLLEDRGEGF
jgi:hypothetical protein